MIARTECGKLLGRIILFRNLHKSTKFKPKRNELVKYYAMSSFGLEIFSQIFHLTLKFFPCYTILKFVGQDFYRNTPCVVSCPHP